MAKKKSNAKVKLAFFAGLVLALAVFMAFTRPSAADHQAVAQDRFEQVAYSYLGASGDGLVSLIVQPAVSKLVQTYFKVENYGVVSVGKIVDPNSADAEPTTISVGLFNHVFCPSAEYIRKRIDETDEVKAIKDIFNSLR